MSKKRSIFYSALLLTGVNLLLRLAGTSFQVYLSGRIGAAGIGLLQLVLSVGYLAMTAGMAGIRTATMYLTAEELGRKTPQNIARVLSVCLCYSLLFSGLVGCGLYGFAEKLAQSWIGDLRTVPALHLLAVFIPVSCLCGVMTGYFTAANRIGTLAAVEIVEQLCAMAVTVVLLALWAGTDAGRACLCVVLGSSLGSCVTVILLVVLRLRERAPGNSHVAVVKRLCQAALPLALADVVKSGISTTENLMVPKRLQRNPDVPEPMAAFGMVTGMVFPVIMFPACILFGMAELLIPELARCAASGGTSRIRYLVRRGLRVCILYGSVLSGLLFLLAEPLCLRLYRNAEAAHYLKLYALLVPMLYCDAITDAMTKGLGQQKACVRYNIITSAMDVALLFVLLPHYGMLGYFASFFLSHGVNFFLSIRRLLKISGESVSVSVATLIFAAQLGSVWAASFVSGSPGRVCAYLAVLGCLWIFCGVVRWEDVLWLKGIVKGSVEN